MKAVYLLATLDTKGREAAFAREALAARGVAKVLVDAGCQGEPAVASDVPRDRVFEAAGTTRAALLERGDRAAAVAAASTGAARLVAEAHGRGELAGVLALGGSAGTTIGTAAMRALPIGVPKLMVSTVASGQVRPYVADKDILMLNSVVDILGLNRISRAVLGEAARAMSGLVLFADRDDPEDRPLVTVTMFGVTTPCVMRARDVLEAAGYEVLVFHATGNGGQAMESLIREGLVAGVLDVTTTELADEVVGGVFSAGPDRLTAAVERGVPQVVSVGALDMVNFHAPETVPARFSGRKLHRHNANVTLMRTTPDENAALGETLGRKLSRARGPAEIWLPLRGVSALDSPGAPFDDPDARHALYDAIRRHSGPIPVVEMDRHINDPEFAEAAANRLIEQLAASRAGATPGTRPLPSSP
ncbi:Tm-1-like ATP-binding domain-containing protein [Paludisphaera sp.]|uniref:Tm-1-like ATP-binding domain-containing protein n=1 Tax=Paludisphaera sp. TaxID=2017432 RepID=UPI00301DB1F5